MSELDDWTHRINETANRIARLMQTDARRFVIEAMREAFVGGRTPADAAEVAQLKAETLAAADRIAEQVQGAIEGVAWAEVSAEPEAEEAPRITDVRAVSDAIDAMVAQTGALIEAKGFAAELNYQLPQRFIDHDALPTLTRTLFKAIARHAALRAEDEARLVAQTAEARRRLWEQA